MLYNYAGTMNSSQNINVSELLDEEGFFQNPREDEDDAEDKDDVSQEGVSQEGEEDEQYEGKIEEEEEDKDEEDI